MKKPVVRKQKTEHLASVPLHPWERSIVRRLRMACKRSERSLIIMEVENGHVFVRDASLVKMEKVN